MKKNSDTNFFYFWYYKYNEDFSPTKLIKNDPEYDLNKILLKDLYLEFTHMYLLDKPYIQDIITILILLKKKYIEGKLCNKDQIEAQVQIEKIIYKNIKKHINSSILSLFSKPSGEYNTIEKLFIDRFIQFKHIFNENKTTSRSLDFVSDLISFLLDDPDKDIIFYMFINILFTDIFDHVRFKNKNLNLNITEEDLTTIYNNDISIKIPSINKSTFFNLLLKDLSSTIHSNFILKLFYIYENKNKQEILNRKLNELEKIFLQYDPEVINYSSYENKENYRLLFNTWVDFLGKNIWMFIPNEHSIKNFINLEKYRIEDEDKKQHDINRVKKNFKLNLTLSHECFLILLKSAEKSKLIEKGFDKSDKYTQLFLHSDFKDLHTLFFINKKFDPPFVAPPKKYKYNKTKSQIFKFDSIEGGYHTKDLQEIHSINRYQTEIELQSINSKVKLDSINYLQSIPLTINTDHLKWLLELPFQSISLDYRRKISLSDYLGLTQNRRSINSYINMQNFLFSLFIADLYSCLPIYFTNSNDPRHRLYITGNPLNFQSDKLFRDLFIFSFDINKNEKDFIKHDSSFLEDYINNTKNFYHKTAVYNDSANALFNFDANSSVFQISAGLSYNFDILTQTGVLNPKLLSEYEWFKYKHFSTIDVYEQMKTILLEKLDYKAITNHYQEFLDKNQNHLTSHKFILSLPGFLFQLKNSITRKMIKSHLMPFSYNKTKLEMIKTYKKTPFLNSYFSKSYIDSEHIYIIATQVIETLLEEFEKKYPSIILLKSIFSKLSDLSSILNISLYVSLDKLKGNDEGHIIPLLLFNPKYSYKKNKLNIDNNKNFNLTQEEFRCFKKSINKLKKLGFYQSYYKQKKKIFKKQKSRERMSVSMKAFSEEDLNNNTLTMDSINNKLGLYPNVTQHIDSLLLYGVLTYCRIKNIPLLVIHDSFSTYQGYYQEIRLAYALSYYFIISNDSLNNIINNILFMIIKNDETNCVIDFLKFISYKDKFNNIRINENKITDLNAINDWRLINQKKYLFKSNNIKKIIDLIIDIITIYNQLAEGIIEEDISINGLEIYNKILFQNLIENFNYLILSND